MCAWNTVALETYRGSQPDERVFSKIALGHEDSEIFLSLFLNLPSIFSNLPYY